MLTRIKDALRGASRATRASPPDPYPRIDLFEWRPADGSINFGDHLARIIVSRILSSRGLMAEEEVDRPRRLFSIGSVLHFATTGDVVWGSGVNGKIPADRHSFSDLDVRAVRGPRTAEFLRARGLSVPDVYGDPALLLPVLFPSRFHVRPERPVLFVPNLHDSALPVPNIPTVSPFRGWNKVIEQIVGSKLVVASSLHGLIIAEAFGIPARYVRLSEAENLFKYEDYVFGTGRDRLDYASSIEAAIEMGGMPPIRFDPEPLLKAFPWDLWG